MSFESLISYIACLFSLILAGFVLRRNPKSLVHRVFAAGMLGLGADAALIGLNIGIPSLFMQKLRLGLNAFLPGVWLLFSIIFARKDFQEYLKRWKWLILASFAAPVFLLTLFHHSLFDLDRIADAVSLPPTPNSLPPLLWAGQSLIIISLLGYILILMNLEKTLRAATGIMRWQVKFTVFGLGVLFAVHIYTLSQIALFRVMSPDFELIKIGGLIFADLLILRSLFRTKFFNVEIYVSQSILYNSLTILIVGVYFIAVGVLAEISVYIGGDEQFPLKAFFLFFAISGVAILVFSDRFRRGGKLFISRNFHRPIYDYRKEWTRFTQDTATISDMTDLCRTISGKVSETIGSLSVSVWLFDEKSGVLSVKASTGISGNKPEKSPIYEKEVKRFAEIMQGEKDPIDFDLPESSWSSKAAQLDKDFLKDFGIRYCVSLNAGEEFIGVLTLGSRIAGDVLSLEDFDLLKTIADQAAVTSGSPKLAEELKKTTEMESFQRMSTFFVHDLKNLASKLSLTVQNIPIHFEKKEFREDAIKTIGQSLEKINLMCNQLSSFGRKLELKPQENDVNEIVRNSISSLQATTNGKITQDLSLLPKIRFDAEQIERVLTNLILNATQAISREGEIKIRTGRINGWAEISVQDNGCGMSREFMEKSLFHPFKTTKKNGMGIGLFQSKMIVEAHGGKIEVESEEGVGSTFRVLLPIK